jgi:glycosyltransferase involved in cell wall biosynthesis
LRADRETGTAVEGSERARAPAAPQRPAQSTAQDPRGDAKAAPEVSIIVPVLSAEARVREVVDALGGELERLKTRWECILVFDGVRGPAWAEAARLAAARPNHVRPIAFQQAFGESVCLSAGFEKARGGIVVTSPQYVQIDPHELGSMLAAIRDGADFVTPWRHPRVDPLLNRMQSAFFNWVMRRIIHMKFHDLNCYFRAIRREVLEELALYGDMYRFLPVIAFRQGFRVVEVQVRHLEEWGGAGFFGIGVYVRRFLDILGMVFLAKFTLKPLRFFGVLGGSFLVGGGILTSVMVWQKFFNESGVYRGLYQRPLFLIGLLLVVLGVQIIGFGLVGEIIIYTQAGHLREYRVERIFESRSEKDERRDPDSDEARRKDDDKPA